jgi:hypothetical protein
LPYASFVVFVSSNGNSLFDTAALLACMRYFPEDKAAVAGVLKAYLGLSSAVFQQMYATFVPVSGYDGGGGDGDGDGDVGDGNRAARFVLLVAFVGGAVAVMGAPFFLVRDTPVSVVDDAVWTTRERRKRTSAVLSRLNRLVIFLVGRRVRRGGGERPERRGGRRAAALGERRVHRRRLRASPRAVL